MTIILAAGEEDTEESWEVGILLGLNDLLKGDLLVSKKRINKVA